MTPAERVAYAHGRIARDMQDFQRQIDQTHKYILRERNLWLALVALSTAMLMIVFYISGPNRLTDYILIGVVFVTFTAIRLLSYRMMKRQIEMLEGMQYLYSRLANDETVEFVTESLKVEAETEKKQE